MECLQQVIWDAGPSKEEQAGDMYSALVNELSAQVVVENVLQHRPGIARDSTARDGTDRQEGSTGRNLKYKHLTL